MRIAHKQRGRQEIEITVVVEYNGPYTLEDRVVEGITDDVGKAVEGIERTWRAVRFAE